VAVLQSQQSVEHRKESLRIATGRAAALGRGLLQPVERLTQGQLRGFEIALARLLQRGLVPLAGLIELVVQRIDLGRWLATSGTGTGAEQAERRGKRGQ